MAKERDTWGGNFGFLMAAIGSAVGLGNIWGFPYKMGANGGFAFLLVYLILAVVVGFVVMLAELTIGRKSGKGCVGTYKRLAGRKRFQWIGWMGVLSAFLITGFYAVLGGYCIKYAVLNFADIFGSSFGSTGRSGGKIFSDMLTNQGESVFYGVLFMALTYAIIAGGIKDGIEKFSKWAMPALFVMLLVVIVRSVTLPGAMKGLEFMFVPNFKPLAENFLGVLSVASGQLFFSLSLGMAIMITYGSYLSKHNNLERSSWVIVVADTVVAILAGIAVIPAAFALGGQGAALAGPKLLYITLQNVFHAMGALGPWIGVIFYVLVVIAAVTSSISLCETIVTFFLDKAEDKDKEGNRKLISFWVCFVIGLEAVLVAVDGLGSNGVWVPFQSTLGVHGWNDCWLDFLDFFSEGFMMPLGAFLTCLFITYELSIEKFGDEIRLYGNKFSTEKIFTICCKYVTPLILLFVLYNQLKSFGLF